MQEPPAESRYLSERCAFSSFINTSVNYYLLTDYVTILEDLKKTLKPVIYFVIILTSLNVLSVNERHPPGLQLMLPPNHLLSPLHP